MRRTVTAALTAALTATLATVLTVTVLPALPAQAAVFNDRLQVLGPLVAEPAKDDADQSGALGRRLVYAGWATGTGPELWITDGTRRGTRLVRDILPGPDGSDPTGFTFFKGRIWFQAGGVGGVELWVTDGTTAGTKRVLDIAPGAESGAPQDLTVAGDTLYFSAYTAAAGRELWATDGTARGTRLVRDLAPGTSGSYPHGLTPFGSRIAFDAQSEPERSLPYVSDGTAARTYRLDDLDQELTVIDGQFVVLGARLLFSASDDSGIGAELYSSRGGRGDATLVKDIEAGDSSYPEELTRVGDLVVFTAFDEDHGRELWRTDGTTAGTRLLRDIYPGADSSDPENLTRSGDAVFFAAVTPEEGEELWVTRGTAATTRLVRDLNVGDDSDPYIVGGLGGRVLLTAYRAGIGREFFTSNGTASGTRLVEDHFPGTGGVGGYELGRARGTFFFGLAPQEPSLDEQPRLTAYTLPAPTVRGTPASSYSRSAAQRREIRVRVGVRAAGIGVTGRVVLYRGERAVGSALVRDGVARVRITVRLAPGRHLLRARFLGSIDAQDRTSPTFALRVR